MIRERIDSKVASVMEMCIAYVLQINIEGWRVSQGLVYAIVIKKEIVITVVCEPNKMCAGNKLLQCYS